MNERLTNKTCIVQYVNLFNCTCIMHENHYNKMSSSGVMNLFVLVHQLDQVQQHICRVADQSGACAGAHLSTTHALEFFIPLLLFFVDYRVVWMKALNFNRLLKSLRCRVVIISSSSEFFLFRVVLYLRVVFLELILCSFFCPILDAKLYYVCFFYLKRSAPQLQ